MFIIQKLTLITNSDKPAECYDEISLYIMKKTWAVAYGVIRVTLLIPREQCNANLV